MDTASMYADFAQRHNKLFQTIKSLSASAKDREQRICDIEQKLESISKEDRKVDQIIKRLVNLETKAAKNQEEMNSMETIVEEFKKPSDHNADIERVTVQMKLQNENLQKGIHDLDEQISSLDDQYKSIKGMIELKKSNCEETRKTVIQN